MPDINDVLTTTRTSINSYRTLAQKAVRTIY